MCIYYIKCNSSKLCILFIHILNDYVFYKYTTYVYSSSSFDTYSFFSNENSILNVELFSHMQYIICKQ